MPYADPDKAREHARLRQQTYRERHPERVKEQQRAQRVNNLEYRREKDLEQYYKSREKQRDRILRKKYNLSSEEYNDMIAMQGMLCAICRREYDPESWKKRFHVDHNHTTGKVRGILCGPCNRGIGYLQDDIEILKAAIRYLDAD